MQRITKAYLVEVLHGCICHMPHLYIDHGTRSIDEYAPNVFGNVFSKRRAKSGSLRRLFMSLMTFCTRGLYEVAGVNIPRLLIRAPLRPYC